MKKQLYITALFLLSTIAPLCAEGKKEASIPATSDATTPGIEIAQISEAFGHLIGKNLETIGVKFDLAQVIKGLQDASLGKESPMTEVECVQAIASIQETIFKEQSSENLKQAEAFLAENTKKEGIVTLENGKVQYLIASKGKGATVEPHFSPLIHYTGKYLDGSVFSSSKEEERISLEEIIPGLKAGMVGMKEGEKRTVYIHPDLAYGTSGYLKPNSLLAFEVEVVKANAPQPETVDLGERPSVEIAEQKGDVR